MAEAVGFRHVFRFSDARDWASSAGEVLALPGPTFVHAEVEAGNEGPIGRTPAEPARYLQHSLAEWSRVMRDALLG